jgi:hypothetical protein
MKRSYNGCLPTDCNTCDRYETKRDRILTSMIYHTCESLGVAKYQNSGRHPLCPKMMEDRLLEAEDILQSIINNPNLNKHIDRIKDFIEVHPCSSIE